MSTNEAQESREMTLREYVHVLPTTHLARKQYDQLVEACDAAEEYVSEEPDLTQPWVDNCGKQHSGQELRTDMLDKLRAALAAAREGGAG